MTFKTYSPLLLSIALITAACGPSKHVSMSITQPAEISLPADINTLLLIDRTKFSNETMNILEGIFTGELPADDKNAAQQAMMNLKSKLDQSPRYSVKILPDRLEGNSVTGSFPQALSWNKIDQLCKSNNAELVVALELFDTDFIVTNGTRLKKRTVGEGKNAHEEEYTEYYAQGVGNIKMGIRTYYNNDKSIVDQQIITKSNTWEAVGSNAIDAAALLISKSNANKHLAGMVGGDYAYKISPMPVRISRSFYGKSKHVPEMKTGTRYADVNKWEDAINEWKKGLAKAEEKEAGQLAYNIAIGYEVLGEYGTALTWAQDSYTKYGNKLARDYAHSLENRISDETILKSQMEH